MTQFLSLVFGRSFSPGLSGGATLFPSSGPAFAELLAAPAADPVKAPAIPAPRAGPPPSLLGGPDLGHGLGLAGTSISLQTPQPGGAQPLDPASASLETIVGARANEVPPMVQGASITEPTGAADTLPEAPASEEEVPENEAIDVPSNAPTGLQATSSNKESAPPLPAKQVEPSDAAPAVSREADPDQAVRTADALSDKQLSHVRPKSGGEDSAQPEQTSSDRGSASPEAAMRTVPTAPATPVTNIVAPLPAEQSASQTASERKTGAAIQNIGGLAEGAGDRRPSGTAFQAAGTEGIAKLVHVDAMDIAASLPAEQAAQQMSQQSLSQTAPGRSAPDERVSPTDMSASERKTGAAMQNIGDLAEGAAARRPSGTAFQAAGSEDFAKLVRVDASETAAPLAEGGPVASDVVSQTRIDPPRAAAAPAATPAPAPATVSARPGEIGRQLGVEVARSSLDGRDSLIVRLDPVEFGEIQIRLQFDEKGSLRAHITAESSVALEMLRRESGDLVRALGDAGLRTDAQSFQFDTRGHGRGEQQGQNRQPAAPWHQNEQQLDTDADDQPLRHKLQVGGGNIDLFA